MERNNKNEKGSITLFVLMACLFFLFILGGLYISNMNKMQIQEQQIAQIQENYAKDLSRIDEVVENIGNYLTITFINSKTKEIIPVGGFSLVIYKDGTIIKEISREESITEKSIKDKLMEGEYICKLIKVPYGYHLPTGEYDFKIENSDKNKLEIEVSKIAELPSTRSVWNMIRYSNDSTSYDNNKECSIKVKFKNSDAEYQIVPIGKYDETTNEFVLNDDIQSKFGNKIKKIENDGSYFYSYSFKDPNEYVLKEMIDYMPGGTTRISDSNGEVTFDYLSTGVYFVKCISYPRASFVISIPYHWNDGGDNWWSYDVYLEWANDA